MNAYLSIKAIRDPIKGFSLAEITLCLGIIATALVTVLGVLPTGLDTSRKAMDHTVIATILEDVHHRLQGSRLLIGPVSLNANGDPAYFDEQGAFIPATVSKEEMIQRRVYRADLVLSDWLSTPTNTSELKSVTVSLSWPIDPSSGEPLAKGKDRSTVTFGVTPLTGPDWTQIDVDYVPKIEF